MIAMFFNYLFNFFMVRQLPVSSYGELSLMVGILSVILIPSTALQIVLTRRIAKLGMEEKAINDLVKEHSRTFFLYSLIFSAILFFLSPLIAEAFNISGLTLLIQTVSFGVPIGYLLSIARSYLRGKENIRFLSISLALEPALKLFLGVLLVLVGFGLIGATLSLWLGSLFVLFMFFPILVTSKNSNSKKKGKLDKDFWVVAATNIMLTLFLYLDLFFVSSKLGSEQTAYYNVAAITSRVLYFLTGGVLLVFLPKSSKLSIDKDRENIKSLILKSVVILIPIFAGFLIFPSMIISVFYTSNYLPSLGSFEILSVGMIFFSVFNILVNLMWSQKRDMIPLFLSIGLIIIDVLLLNYFIPISGISGAALATTFSSLIVLVSSLFAVKLWVLKDRFSG